MRDAFFIDCIFLCLGSVYTVYIEDPRWLILRIFTRIVSTTHHLDLNAPRDLTGYLFHFHLVFTQYL